jgi:hypothetical protein
MYLHLLELIYAVEDGDRIQMWLSDADLRGVFISSEQYDDQMLIVLADNQPLAEAHKRLRRCPAVSSCEEKLCAVYRIITTIKPEIVFRSFPLRNGEEWYWGGEKTIYLCLTTHELSKEQISWLVTCRHIAEWEGFFNLGPRPKAVV